MTCVTHNCSIKHDAIPMSPVSIPASLPTMAQVLIWVPTTFNVTYPGRLLSADINNL